MHFVTREVGCPNCETEVQLEPLPSELEEMETIARLRLLNAKKVYNHIKFDAATTKNRFYRHPTGVSTKKEPLVELE